MFMRRFLPIFVRSPTIIRWTATFKAHYSLPLFFIPNKPLSSLAPPRISSQTHHHLHLDHHLQQPSSSSSSVINNNTQMILSSILSRPGWQNDPSLKEIASSLTPSLISALFNPPALVDATTALDFFHWIARQPGYHHNSQSHASLLNLLVRARLLHSAEKVRLSMITSCTSAGDMCFVLDFIRRMNREQGEFKMTLRCYNCLMCYLSRFKMTDAMKDVFLEIFLDDQIAPDILAYNWMIYAHCQSGDFDGAFRVFSEMQEKGCEPNVPTYTLLIGCLCWENKLEDAHGMLNEMLEKGLAPSVVSYSALIYRHCMEGKVDTAFALLRFMELNGCEPNAFTYDGFIYGLCKIEKVEEAMGLLNEMSEKGLSPDLDLITYNLLICGQCKNGEIDSAFRLLDLMSGNGLSANLFTYSALIVALCRDGRIEEAHELFDSLSEKNLKADGVIYTALIRGNCKAGNIDRAHLLLDRMVDEGCLDSRAYNALMDGLCKERKIHEALALLDKMVEMGVKPDEFTYTILIDEMLKEGDFDRAYEMSRKWSVALMLAPTPTPP